MEYLKAIPDAVSVSITYCLRWSGKL
jgi:hypothetical protein